MRAGVERLNNSDVEFHIGLTEKEFIEFLMICGAGVEAIEKEEFAPMNEAAIKEILMQWKINIVCLSQLGKRPGKKAS